MENTIAVKLAKPIGRHYGKRLYKAGKIYHVTREEGEYLLAYKDLDGVNRFKRMIPKGEVKAPTSEVEVPDKPKRKRGRPKKSPKIDDVVDEKPVETKADEEADEEFVEEETKSELVEEKPKAVEESEFYDPSDDNQEYLHEA